MKLVYFAWVRERIGKPEEEVALPPAVTTVADLVRWLARARRGIRLRLREPEGGPRRDRPHARQAGHGDRRRPRDRLLPADDGRVGPPARSGAEPDRTRPHPGGAVRRRAPRPRR